MIGRVVRGVVIAALIVSFSGSIGAADDDAARRILVQQAWAQQLMVGIQADGGTWPQSWPQQLALVTRMVARDSDAKALDIARKQWRLITGGQRYDVVRGGFFSSDAGVKPAKPLREQALITDVVLDAVQLSGDGECREAAVKNIDFVLRDLRLAAGGFAASDVLAATGSSPDRQDRSSRNEEVITSWNGLMVGALAHGFAVLGNQAALVAAEQTEEFLLTRCTTATDCIAVIHGALALYQVTGGVRWLVAALDLQQRIDQEFWDAATASYRVTGPSQLPDGLAIMNVLRLAVITDDDHFHERAKAMLTAAISQGNGALAQTPGLLCAIDQQLGPAPHLTIVGDPAASDTRALFSAAHRTYQPRLVIVTHAGDQVQAGLRKRFPAMIPSPQVDGKATAYLCIGMMCNRPTTDPAVLEKQLAAVSYRW